MTGRITVGFAAFAWVALATAASAHAQPTAPAAPREGLGTDPIRCWWRTSVGAVRVGEPFDVFLTCAVLDTESITVVPDLTGLEPEAVQLPPFEVLDGSHPDDVRTDDRRFFQYRYELRLMVDDAFGRDVALPSLTVSYRVRSPGSQGTSIEGRDQTFVLPPISIRVLSLVPDELTDIRDAGGGSFGELASRTLRSRVMLVLGALFMLLGAILAIATAVRMSGERRDRGRAPKALLSDGGVLRGVLREVTAIGRDRQQQGWTQELAGRALATLRVAASFLVSGRVIQTAQAESARSAAPSGGTGQEGQLRLRAGWLGGRSVRVSGWETAESVGQALARDVSRNGRELERARLELLQVALARFTKARYGRDDERVDDSELDRSLAECDEVVRQLGFEQRRPVRLYRTVQRFADELRSRVWPR